MPLLRKIFRVYKQQGLFVLGEKIVRALKFKKYKYIVPQKIKEVEDFLSSTSINKPLFSLIVPLYNTEEKMFNEMLSSIKNQWYENWELILIDDASPSPHVRSMLDKIDDPKIIKVLCDENKGIAGATNVGVDHAKGDYIVCIDHDDEITPDCLYEIAKVIVEEDADFIYSDEDLINEKGKSVSYHFKPDFNPDLLLSNNYITHVVAVKKSLREKVGYLSSKYDAAQDYDYILRATEKAKKIVHIPKVLYHWRAHQNSTAGGIEAKYFAIENGKLAVEDALIRRGIAGGVENANLACFYRVKYTIKGNPLVSIIIPFKDKPELLKMCIESIITKSTYQNFEIIGISNNNEEKETFNEMERLQNIDKRISFYEYNVEYNYSHINNYAVEKYAKGEHILLLNNDIEIITDNWIEEMLMQSQRKEIGCVGAKLYYPNNTIQHAGIVIGIGGFAGHIHKGLNRESIGYFNKLNIIQNMSAVTAACMMVKKSIYQEMDGLNEVELKISLNDVDICLRIIEKGYYNVFTPYAEAYHHESISRGYDDTSEKKTRFNKEIKHFQKRHKDILQRGDPFYNPNFTLERVDYSLK